jgi:hypothetical protein
MDCKTARLLLEFRGPRARELAVEEAAELEGHLAACPDCDAALRAERRLDDHIGRAVRDVPVPDQLREQLLARLRDERGTRLRGRLAWAARGLSVAAALVLCAFLWWHFVGSKPPLLDINQVADADVQQHRLVGPENVQAWFREQRHVVMVPPKQFNYLYLADYDVVEWQGRKVPKLVFFRPDDNASARARVYVVTTEQFDLSRLPPPGGPYDVDDSERFQVWQCDSAPGTRYVIFYTGDNLDPLLDPSQPLM